MRIVRSRSARLDAETKRADKAVGVREAFVAGAAWWEFESTGGTIWTSDRREAEEEAERRYPNREWVESPRLAAAEAEVARLRGALQAARDLLYAVCSAHTGSIGGIGTHYLPQISKAWLAPIEQQIDAALSGTAPAQPAPLEEAVLSRESFLRHIHNLADTNISQWDGLHPSEIALCEHDTAMRRRTGLSPGVLAREESEPVHRLLTKRGVPEQIPPFKTPRASLYVRVLAVLTERDAAKAALSVARNGGGNDAV